MGPCSRSTLISVAFIDLSCVSVSLLSPAVVFRLYYQQPNPWKPCLNPKTVLMSHLSLLLFLRDLCQKKKKKVANQMPKEAKRVLKTD